MTAVATHPRGLFPAIVDAVAEWETRRSEAEAEDVA